MTIDRRSFTQLLLAGAGTAVAGFPRDSVAAPTRDHLSAALVVDARSGRMLHRSGVCATRFSPCSTFKIPLALMGFDAGILTDAHHPAWDYRPSAHRAGREVERQRTDPTSWESNSVVWYSQEITKQLGARRFQDYVDRFGYGNRDLGGNPGKNDGLTQAWLLASLTISPDEQVAFLRRMLGHRLVSQRAHALAESIIPVFEGAGGWRVHGKTGSGWLGDKSRPLGWFVGWADKGARRVVFARFEGGAALSGQPGGMVARKALLAEIGTLAK